MSIKAKIKKLNTSIAPGNLLYGPKWVVLGVNNICNLHCKMCDVGVDFNESNFFENLMGSKPINMPIELLTKVLKQTKEYYPKAKIGYAFTEPLIYPHLIESLKLANNLQLFTSITTNALNLKRYGDQIIESGLNEINISLDGPQDIHNEIRGHKSSFQKAVEGIELLLKHKNRPTISIYCVITEWNIGYLKEFIAFFKDYPLKEIGFMHTNYTTQSVADIHNKKFGHNYFATASNMESLDFSKMDLPKLQFEIAEIKSMKTKFPISFSPEINTKQEIEAFYNQPLKLMGKRCHDVFNNIMVKSNGTVIPAHGRCYNLTIGNVYDNSIKEIWNSKAIAGFRRTLNKAGGLLPACSRCCSAFGN